MDYKKGERVKHPGRPTWGLGQVLEDSRDDKVRIFFSGEGPKTLSLKYVEPTKIAEENARHPMLDHLSIKEGGGVTYRSLQQAKENFIERYAEGFYGQDYLKEHRNSKVAAHDLALKLMGPGPMKVLLDQGDYDEIGRRAVKVAEATKLIFPGEKTALKAGLKNADHRQSFSETLYTLLYENGDLKGRFLAFTRTLRDVGVAKWATLSYFPFVVFPDRYIFFKPNAIQLVAEISAFEIHYRPELNWRTYQSVMDFSEYFRSGLADLKPRDMIDIQSFMGCMAG